ncbi:MAG: hypothetical protein VZQ97_03740 [Candidatus Onthomonas sp.]|nr:hypothetical protein [Candidatus Onthomonas sp.]
MAYTRAEFLDRLLAAFQRYYNISRENATPSFAAEAAFHSNNEQYFLFKSAKLSDAESHEYIFIASEEHLDLADAERLDRLAWETGLSRVTPHSGHRNTDITLILLADTIAPEAMAMVKKTHRYQSYRHMLHGWSDYRLVALELSTGQLTYNRKGQSLRKLFRNILSSLE